MSTAGSREGECAHGHPVVRKVVDGWVEERSTPFDASKRGKDQGCKLCDPEAVLLRYREPAPEPWPGLTP